MLAFNEETRIVLSHQLHSHLQAVTHFNLKHQLQRDGDQSLLRNGSGNSRKGTDRSLGLVGWDIFAIGSAALSGWRKISKCTNLLSLS